MEIAKLRAARRIWAKVMKEKFNAKSSKSLLLRTHCQTSGYSLTEQDPYNNIIRTAVEAMAAVMGGTQSLHTNSYDEALGLPTEESALIALRTQQVIACESGVADAADPLGGSYLVEHLTDSIEQKASELIAKIDAMGGMVRAIEEGFPQECIQRSAYEYQKKVEDEKELVVGVNIYKSDNEPAIPIMKIDESGEKAQVARLAKLRSERDSGRFSAAMAALENGAKNGANLMPLIVEAARCRATLGEISDALRKHFGEHRESVIV